MLFFLACALAFISGVLWDSQELSWLSYLTLFTSVIFLIADMKKDYKNV